MELDCAICENVYFDKVDSGFLIKCFIKNDVYENIYFYRDGTTISAQNAKCVIFPKGKTTWEGFQRPFKDGDVIRVIINKHLWYGIYKKELDDRLYCYVSYSTITKSLYNPHHSNLCSIDSISEMHFATEEEKEKLFQAIKDNGYKWNPETKTLEKLVKPKFKVGDEIVKRNFITNSWIVNSVSSEYYGLRLDNGIGVLPVSEQDDWELITNKLEKSVEPKFKVGDIIQDEDAYKVTITEVNVEDKLYEYESTIAKGIGGIAFSEQDNWKLVPNKFDITTLKPFDKVLVRDFDNTPWEIEFFSRLLDGKYFKCLDVSYIQCIPYKANEHLLGTTNDCDGYYKTWK
jgi:hypothetical protein